MEHDILIISGRKDAFGSRMRAFTNAWYIAQKLNCAFGFVWPKPNGPMSFFNKNNKNLDVLFDVFSEDELFSQEFCSKYSYTSKLEPFECHLIVDKKIYFKDLLSLNKKIIYAPLCNLKEQFYDFDEEDFFVKTNEFWNLIKFDEKLQDLAIELKKQIQTIGNYSAVHIRGGEIVHCDNIRRAGNYAYKALPIELAVAKIEEELRVDNNVILLQDDTKTCEDIKRFFNNQNFKAKVYTFTDFAFAKLLNNNERTFLEFILMSESLRIYSSGNSEFSNVAAWVNNINKTSLYEYYNLELQYKILNRYIETIPDIHPLQVAFSYYHLYLMAVKFEDKEQMIWYLKKARQFDSENELYDIFLVNSYLLNSEFDKAEELLKMNFNKRYDSFKKWLLNKFYNSYTSGKVFGNYKKHASEKYPNLSHAVALIYQSEGNVKHAERYLYMSLKESPFFALYVEYLNHNLDIANKQILKLDSEYQKISRDIKKIQEKPLLLGAPSRIKNHLAYRLGQIAVTNSKTIGGYFRLPFNLIKEYKQYNQEQKNYQMMIKLNPTLALPKLQDYDDYQEAVKIKKYFSYRLGEAIIQANNTWYGGGYIKLWFEIKRLKRLKRGKDGYRI
ncbi:hypothetical protein Q9X50_000122 [Campylobacter jejuni]|nr:hypothetical protein [Campylobacter jejuni]ELH5686970.1 hypothetical protein [Campylobacter jejuni]HDV7516069.1 hypothetical protein [Campylobacter jejuni]